MYSCAHLNLLYYPLRLQADSYIQNLSHYVHIMYVCPVYAGKITVESDFFSPVI